MDVKINYKHEQPIIDTIKNYPIFSFIDIFVYYKAISRPTAYNHGLDKLDSIKEAIYQNRRKGVTSMLSKWIKSDNPTLQIAAMRLLCDSEEHRKLNQNYTDVTTNGKEIQAPVLIVANKESEKEINQEINKLSE